MVDIDRFVSEFMQDGYIDLCRGGVGVWVDRCGLSAGGIDPTTP